LSLEVKASYSRDKKQNFLGEDMTTSREYQRHIWFYFLNLETRSTVKMGNLTLKALRQYI
jgi:hypothetical protein